MRERSVIGVNCTSRTSKLDESVQIFREIVVSFQGQSSWALLRGLQRPRPPAF